MRARGRYVLIAGLIAACGARTGFVIGEEPLAGVELDAGRVADGRSDGRSPPTPAPTGTPRPTPSGEPPRPCDNVTGVWAGTWTSAGGASGTWQTDMVEAADGALSGSSVVTGTSCGTTSKVVGDRNGCAISFGLADFASCTVEFVGTLQGDQMAGTFVVSAGISDRGEWRGTKIQ